MGRATSEDGDRGRLSRRTFLTAAGTAATAAAVPACVRDDRRAPQTIPDGSNARPQNGLDVPEAGIQAVGRFLDPVQVAMVLAIADRVIPGDADDPGAVEAGAVEYIDRLLATHDGYPDRTYTGGPVARTYDGDQPPPEEEGVVWVSADEIDRYGWQLTIPPREIYRRGLARLDALARDRYGTGFADCTGDEQDTLLEALEDAEDDDVTELFEDLPSDAFFDLVRGHVVEGFLSDPVYGGNRGLVGWQLVGFPGSQRGYSPEELMASDEPRPPQGLGQLPMMMAGHREDEHGHALASIRRRHPNGPVD